MWSKKTEVKKKNLKEKIKNTVLTNALQFSYMALKQTKMND